MAQISVFAQPGLAFMGAAQSARENRLAMAAQEAERATEEAQRRAVQQILGVSAPTTGGEQFTRGGAAGVRGVTGGEVGAPITPSAPQAQTGASTQSPSALRYSEQQIRAMMVADPRLAGQMQQQNEADLRQQERDETRAERRRTREETTFDRAAQRVLNAANPEAQLPQTARALADELDISEAEAAARLQRQMQISAAPRDREIESMMRGAGIDPASEEGRRIYQQLLTRRMEGSGMRELAGAMALQARGSSEVAAAVGEQGMRSLVVEEVGRAREIANQAVNVVSLLDQFEDAIEAAGGTGATGIVLSLRGVGAGIRGTVAALSGMGPAGQTLSDFVAAQTADARNSMSAEDFNAFFGDNVGAVQLLGNTLNYANARLNHGAGPLSNQDIERSSVVQGGLDSDGMLFSRLRAVRRTAETRHQRAEEDLNRLRDTQSIFEVPPLPQRRTPGQPASAAPQSGASATPRRSDYSTLQEYLDAVDEALADG
jgi:hypothetical protein